MSIAKEDTLVISMCRCGEKPQIMEIPDNPFAMSVYCDSCGAGAIGIEVIEAIENWNALNRTDQDLYELTKKLTKVYEQYVVSSQPAQPATDWRDILRNIPNTPKRLSGFVYIAHTAGTNNYKIGSALDISRRFKGLKTGNPHLRIIATKESLNRRADEAMLHKLFESKRISGEWFELSAEQLSALITQYGFNYHLEASV